MIKHTITLEPEYLLTQLRVAVSFVLVSRYGYEGAIERLKFLWNEGEKVDEAIDRFVSEASNAEFNEALLALLKLGCSATTSKEFFHLGWLINQFKELRNNQMSIRRAAAALSETSHQFGPFVDQPIYTGLIKSRKGEFNKDHIEAAVAYLEAQRRSAAVHTTEKSQCYSAIGLLRSLKCVSLQPSTG